MVIGIIGKVGSGKSACVEYIEKEYGATVFSCDLIAKEIIENHETDYVPLPSSIFFRSKEAQEECRNKVHNLVFDRIKQRIENIVYNNHNLNKNNINELFDTKSKKYSSNFADYVNFENNTNNKNIPNFNNNLKIENIKNPKNKNNFQLKDIDNSNKKNSHELIVIECALPSEKLFEMCDKVIYIRNSYEDKVKLLYEKRGYTEEATKLIYDSQAYYDKFYDRADIIVDNDGTKSDLEKKIKEVIDEIYIIRK